MIADLIGLGMLLLLGLGIGLNPFPPGLGSWPGMFMRSRLFVLMVLISISMLFGWMQLYAQYGLRGLTEDEPTPRPVETLTP